MSAAESNDLVSGDELDIKALFNYLWKCKSFIVVFTFVFITSAIYFSLKIPNQYKSTALLMPSSSNSSSVSNLASQFGGLASLAGINVGNNGVDKVSIAIELIKTWGFLEGFAKANKIEADLVASRAWNKSNDSLDFDEEIYDVIAKKWKVNDNGISFAPSGWQLFSALKGKIEIARDKQSGVVSLSVEHYSPSVAQKWVNLLVSDINKHMQERDQQEAKKSIEYLKEQIVNTDIAEMRMIFFQLIEEQTKTLMLTEVNDEYVFKVLSPAKVPEIKSKPSRVLIVIAFTFLGFMSSIVLILIYRMTRNNKS